MTDKRKCVACGWTNDGCATCTVRLAQQCEQRRKEIECVALTVLTTIGVFSVIWGVVWCIIWCFSHVRIVP